MVFDLIRALLAAVLVGVVPGYFWSRCLVFSADRAERLTYSVALSMALVPVTALVSARLLGTGMTLLVAVLSVLIVFGTGLAACCIPGFANMQGPGGLLVPRPALLSTRALIPLIPASALGLGIVLGVSTSPWLLLLMVLLVLVAGVAYISSSHRQPGPRGPVREGVVGHRSPPIGFARRLLLPVVLLPALARGYLGPVLHDWPYIRGVDHYSHAVMANLMLTRGTDESYLIYPPGFHALIAAVSRFSGLPPLQVFPVLAPAFLLLPPLAVYALARRLWGWEYGVAAALVSGVALNSSYSYFNSSMYPNLIAAQFLLVLAVAALLRLYVQPTVRGGLLLALLGSSVVLYHQVSSLYLVLLLVPVVGLFVPYLLLRERSRGLALLLSLVLLATLSIVYSWDTYDVPQTIGSLMGGSKTSITGTSVSMVIGTQHPYSLHLLVVLLSLSVVFFSLLGAFLAADGWWKQPGMPQGLVYLTLLLWTLIMLAGSRTSLSGFPRRFGHDLGVPLALFAALAFVTILRSVRPRRPVSALAVFAVVLLAGTTLSVQAGRNLEEAAGPSSEQLMTPDIASAGAWVRAHNNGGNIMVSPFVNQVPSRAMLAMGGYSALQSFGYGQLGTRRGLPPSGIKPLEDVLWVMNNPAGGTTRQILEKYDIRYVVIYKHFFNHSAPKYWQLFEQRADLYRMVFDNRDVTIFTPRSSVEEK